MDVNNYWFGKRVLVTGGDGFVASHLILRLMKLGAVVVSSVRHARPVPTLNIIASLYDMAGQRPDIEECDLLELSKLRRICDRHQIDTVFHLAASAIVSDAANSPYSTIENNSISTLNILEVARINKIPRVLIVSSDKSYGDHADDPLEGLPYNENYALRGLDVYSASKVACDMYAQTYSFQFKVPVLVARACNIYGPGDLNFTRLIPKTVMCLLSKKSPVINLGNENVLREYIYIDDLIDSYLLLMENVADYYEVDCANMPVSGKNTYGWAAFNVGSYSRADLSDLSACDKIKSVSQVIGLLRRMIEDIEPVIKEKAANFIEIPNQYLNSEKIQLLGFKPKHNFDEGLQRTVDWFKSNHEQLLKYAKKYIG